MTLSFFGLERPDEQHVQRIYDLLENMILSRGANIFYVTDCSEFDEMIAQLLQTLSISHPFIRCYTVLSREPLAPSPDCIYPAGLAAVPPLFADTHRDRWILDRSDFVLAYAPLPSGRAHEGKRMAHALGKEVVDLTEI